MIFRIHHSVVSRIVLYTLFIVLSSTLYSQNQRSISYGIKGGYISYAKQYINGNTIIDGAKVYGSEVLSNAEGFHIGTLVRVERKKWSLQPELTYTTTLGLFGIEGPDPLSYRTANGDYKTLDLTLNAGFKPIRWLRIFTGLGILYQQLDNQYASDWKIQDENTGDAKLDEMHKLENKKINIIQGIEQSCIPFVLTQKFGAGLEIKNFSFDITYERSLTLTRKEIIYEGKSYPFRVSSTRFFFSLGYRFYKFPSFKKKPKSDVPLFKEK